jgi:ubiquinone/menaquinone biosynthesis C-methylase UbiE
VVDATDKVAEPGGGDWRDQILEVKRPPDDVPAIYTRLAPVYEVWARLTESRARRRVLELAEPGPAEDVLEVATGTGAQLVELASRNRGGRTVGAEISAGMLAKTRSRLAGRGLDGVEVVEADARELPFADASFDLIVNSYMLDLLPREEIPRVLGEFLRLLRPGGRLVMSNMTPGQRRAHRIWDALYARGIVLTANCRGVLAAPVLAKLGFVGIERAYSSQLGFPTEIVIARKAGGSPAS